MTDLKQIHYHAKNQ